MGRTWIACLLMALALAASDVRAACDNSPDAEAEVTAAVQDYAEGRITFEQLQAIIDAVMGVGCYDISDEDVGVGGS